MWQKVSIMDSGVCCKGWGVHDSSSWQLLMVFLPQVYLGMHVHGVMCAHANQCYPTPFDASWVGTVWWRLLVCGGV
jgi:hypothetical protein